MSIKYVEQVVSPELAKKLLEANVQNNRKISHVKVREYTQAMLRGEWALNGETIKVTEDGTIIDGQHRLHAIVNSGIPVMMGIMHGVKQEVLVTLDTGKSRTAGDYLTITGNVDSKKAYALAGAVKRAILHDAGRSYVSLGGNVRGLLTNNTIEAYIEANYASLQKSMEWCYGNLTVQGGLLPRSEAIFLHFIMSRSNPEMATDFMTKVLKGVGLEDKTTQFHLHNALLRRKAGVSKISLAAALGTTVKCFNSIVAGRNITHSTNIHWRSEENLPFVK